MLYPPYPSPFRGLLLARLPSANTKGTATFVPKIFAVPYPFFHPLPNAGDLQFKPEGD